MNNLSQPIPGLPRCTPGGNSDLTPLLVVAGIFIVGYFARRGFERNGRGKVLRQQRRSRLAVPALLFIAAAGTGKQMAMLQSAGIDAASHIALYPVSREIERVADENKCSLLVVGSRMHSLAGAIAAGSIAGTVLASARRPLLMLRLCQASPDDSPSCACWPCASLKHLLVPTDFSDNASHAFAYSIHFVKEQAPERITLLHVQDRRRIEPHLTDRMDAFNAEDRNRLEDLRRQLAAVAPETQLDTALSYGHPAQEITEYCRRESVTLVVMGTRGRGYVSELFVGSVSHNVARHAPVPVLLIPCSGS